MGHLWMCDGREKGMGMRKEDRRKENIAVREKGTREGCFGLFLKLF